MNDTVKPRDGRPPPSDLACEAIVVSVLLMEPDRYDELASICEPHMCYSRANREIFQAIVELLDDSKPVDPVLLRGYLKNKGKLDVVGGSAYITQLVDYIEYRENVVEHARRIREKWRQRQAIAVFQTGAAEGYTDVGDVTEWVESYEKRLNEINATGHESELLLAGRVLGQHLTALDEAKQRGESTLGVTTGLVDLDKLTGGLHRGDLTIVAARPGVGKSQFALNVAHAIASVATDGSDEDGPEFEYGVAFFSLEMPAEQVATRIGCMLTKVSLTDARRNNLTENERSDLWGAADTLLKRPLWIDDTAALSMLQLRSRARKLKRQIETAKSDVRCNKLGLVVVDYLQLMTGDRKKNDTREREVASLSAGLKGLAKELDVPVVALSQLNRTVEKSGRKNKRPLLSDLRESGAVEQDADNVWFLFRESYYDDEQAHPTEAEVLVAKQRSGPIGKVDVEFERRYGRFYGSAHETDETFGDIFEGDDDEELDDV